MERGEERGGEEGENARARVAWRRRLIGQEIKLGLGEMAAGREGERESARMHTKYAISHAGVDKKNPFIASLCLSLPSLSPLYFM